MFAYELQQARRDDFQHRADQWRLARDAKAGRADARKARRAAVRSAARTDAAADSAVEGTASPRPAASGRIRRALHPHSAA